MQTGKWRSLHVIYRLRVSIVDNWNEVCKCKASLQDITMDSICCHFLAHAQLPIFVNHSLTVQHIACHGRNMEYWSRFLFLKCFALRFVNCHCKTLFNGELNPFELERCSLCDGINWICGSITILPTNGPCEILAFITLGNAFVVEGLIVQ